MKGCIPLALLIFGYILSWVCFDTIYIYKVFGEDLDNIPNRVLNGLQFMGITMSIMGMFTAYDLGMKRLSWKLDGVKADLSYFRAFKTEFCSVLKKLKDLMKL